MVTRLLLAAMCLSAAAAVPSAQTDLDAFMARVLARRDDNWRKLQQYILDERATFQVTGPGGVPIYGLRREYLWFPRDGRFIRSPLTADGVAIAEAERRDEEAAWLRREARRERRERERAARDAEADKAARETEPDTAGGDADPGTSDDATAPQSAQAIGDALQPQFVSAAYFLRFRFDPNQYALAGRETYEGRDVLRIEYYPTRLFQEGRTRPNRRLRERDDDIQARMNKSSLVTLWIDPDRHQILKYVFTNVDLDFLPGRAFLRIDGMEATMEMGEAFPDVWLPRAIDIGVDVMTALGPLAARFETRYEEYRLAEVGTRVR